MNWHISLKMLADARLPVAHLHTEAMRGISLLQLRGGCTGLSPG